MNESPTYRGEVWATGPRCLLGGVRFTRSSEFLTEGVAQHWLDTALELNRDSGNECEGRVVATLRQKG